MAGLTFVFCVESGILESMTVRAVESLRLFGGRFATSPVVAVMPRRGPSLNQSTIRRLTELDVDHIRLSPRRDFSWYHYLNKPAALAEVERSAQTESIAFLDSDTIVLQEPTALDLEDGVGFSASVSDIALGGTTGKGHPSEHAWARICALTGLTPDDLPWVETFLDHVRIRLYFNSGVMVYRRSQEVGAAQLDLLTKVFSEGIRLPGSAARMIEQVVLAPLILGRATSWRPLPFTHNSTMISTLEYVPEHLRAARILHYHDSMSPITWREFLQRITEERPDVSEWLRNVGPITSPASFLARSVGESLRVARGVRRRANAASVRLAGRARVC